MPTPHETPANSKLEQLRKQNQSKTKTNSIADMETPASDVNIDVNTNSNVNTNINTFINTNVNTNLDTVKVKYGLTEERLKRDQPINLRVPKSVYNEFKTICNNLNTSANDVFNKLMLDFIEQCKNQK